MTGQSIVPPYLLARLVEAGPAFPLAAQAARRALLHRPPYRQARTALQLSVDGDALVLETRPAPDRTISDARGSELLPGTVVRREDDPPVADRSVNEAFDGLGATHAFLWEAFGRDGIDGAGGALDATVHYGLAYDNAFWDGARMVFGDGDGEVFRGFTGSVSVIAHEMSHGVIDHTAPLRYRGQSGALNESVADVFGVLAEQHTLGQTADQATWLVGAGIFTDAVEGRALRSMRAPGTAYDDDVLGRDPQPAHMDGFVETTEDNGGVHINSGIPNRAFCLAALDLGGSAWERAGRIWYRTLVGGVPPDADFRTFAEATVRVATADYGAGSDEAGAVRGGWVSVGVLEDGFTDR